MIHSATVRDATGSLAAAPGTDAGAVLTLWNPDESWSRDALLRVNAVLGPATRTHTIYEHIELVVHPLGVHLNEAIASSFWVRPPVAFLMGLQCLVMSSYLVFKIGIFCELGCVVSACVLIAGSLSMGTRRE